MSAVLPCKRDTVQPDNRATNNTVPPCNRVMKTTVQPCHQKRPLQVYIHINNRAAARRDRAAVQWDNRITVQSDNRASVQPCDIPYPERQGGECCGCEV